MKKKVLTKLRYIDYVCEVGERVWWNTMKGERFEGKILKWNDNVATVLLDDGNKKTVDC